MKFVLFLIFIIIGCNSTNDLPTQNSQLETGSKVGPEKSKENKAEPKRELLPFEKLETTIPNDLYKIADIKEWNAIPEGFINHKTFQVKVTSLKTDKTLAIQEALEVAKRKAHKMLLAEAIPYLSPESKVDLKILIEEYGVIVADSKLIEDKHHFVFQIKRSALQIIVKERLK